MEMDKKLGEVGSKDTSVQADGISSQKDIVKRDFFEDFKRRLKVVRKKKALVIGVILFALMVGIVGLLSQSKNQPQEQSNVSNPNPTGNLTNASPSPTITVNLTDLKTVDSLNVNAAIKVPFVRGENIYLYEDGKEKLVAKSSQKTTPTACYHLLYPLMSSNGKYIAYIEQVGEAPGYGGCTGGILRVVDVQNNTIKATNYSTALFNIYSWDEQNRLRLEASLPDNKVKFAIYDPSSDKELVSEVVDYRDRDAGYRGYPLFNEHKAISYKNKKYFLRNPSSNSETVLLDDKSVQDFRGWLPDGKYALFSTDKQTPEQESAFGSIYYAVNTDNPSEPKKEILVLHGAAGGSFATGNKWYFDKAFASYCSQYLTYLDGTKPLELTNSGGGGCHNEEGFVATSPNGNYAFVKFADRFELHGQDGSKQVVKESTPLTKGRGFPQNLIWLNNDYMVMFESAYGGSSYGGEEKPKIHIYDRQNNTLKPLVQNAYLIESSN